MYTISFTLNNGSTYVNKAMEPRKREVTVQGTKEEIAHLLDNGYLLLTDFLSNDQISNFRDALDKLESTEKNHPNAEHFNDVGHYIRYLLDKDESFHEILKFERPISISRAVLGPQISLDVEARIVPAAVAGMGLDWHIHHRVVPDPLPPLFCYPHAIHGLLYLDDIDLDTGPICILPGSHLSPHLMKSRSTGDVAGQKIIPVKAGTCLLMHANLWHRTLMTTKQAKKRRLILFAFTPSWVKTDTQYGVLPNNNLRNKLHETANEELRELLGNFSW